MTIEVLRSFAALAEHLHFTRAAEHRHITQPALSKHIKQLEAALDVRLLIRNRRSVSLTPEGALLLEQIRHILEGLEELEATAQRLRAGDVGRLRIGFTPSAPHHVLPAIMRPFRQRYPNIDVALLEASSGEQIQQLAAGTLDVGILRPPAECPPSLTIRQVLEERFVAVLPRDHRLSARTRIALADLKDESFILIGRRVAATVHDQIVEACRSVGFVPRVVHEASHIHAIAGLVGAGCGVSVLAASVEHVRLRSVIYRPLTGSGLTTALAMAFPASHRSQATDAFLAVAGTAMSVVKVHRRRKSSA